MKRIFDCSCVGQDGKEAYFLVQGDEEHIFVTCSLRGGADVTVALTSAQAMALVRSLTDEFSSSAGDKSDSESTSP